MIGRHVGRFRVIAELGRGGVGAVWLAQDTLLGRSVALKILDENVARFSEARRRFLREAQRGSQLDHPAIPVVYDFGEHDGLAYIAMGLVDGETLSTHATRCPMAIDEAVRIVADAARALGYAHDKGVIHRDVSGRNIMIGRDGRVFVLDFGLARATDDSRITSTGTLVGTVPYLAPELVLHDRPADRRSDLYALGVVLFEALTGALPYPASPREAAVYSTVLGNPPSPRTLRPDIPPALAAVTMRAIARDPEVRFENAEQFAHALIAILESPPRLESKVDAPVPAASPSVQVAAASRSNADEADRALIAMRGTSYVAVLPFEGDGGDDSRLLGDGLAESLAGSLADLDGVVIIPPSSTRGTVRSGDDAARIARSVGANLVVRGLVRRSGTGIRVTWSMLDPWRGAQVAGATLEGVDSATFELEDRLSEGVCRALGHSRRRPREHRRVPRDPAAHERYLQALGYLERRDSEAALDGAIGLLERLLDSEGDSANVHAALGRAYLERYRLTPDRSWETRAAVACQRALELDPDAPEVLVTLGELHVACGRHEESLREFERALEQRPRMFDALLGLARAEEASGRWDRAETACRRALAIRPADWRGHSRLGVLLFNQGRYAEASGAFRRVVELTPDNPGGLYNLGSSYYRLDRLEDAHDAFRRSLEIRPTALGFANLGTVLFILLRFDEAAAAFEKAAALSPADPLVWGNLGSACRQIPGREKRAGEALERAIALMRERLDRNPRDAESWAWLSAWLANRAQRDEAIAAIDRALALAPLDVHCMATAGSVFFVLGERPKALHWFREAVSRGYGVEKLRRDPELTPLRSDPEFTKILEEGSARRGADVGVPIPPGGAA